MLSFFDSIAKGYKTYTSTALSAALALYANAKGLDAAQVLIRKAISDKTGAA